MSKDANTRWDNVYGSVECQEKKFKVKFSDIANVHYMRVWPFAHREARKGLWMQLARDNERFKMRIYFTELTIQHVFDKEHREYVYMKYFE